MKMTSDVNHRLNLNKKKGKGWVRRSKRTI